MEFSSRSQSSSPPLDDEPLISDSLFHGDHQNTVSGFNRPARALPPSDFSISADSRASRFFPLGGTRTGTSPDVGTTANAFDSAADMMNYLLKTSTQSNVSSNRYPPYYGDGATATHPIIDNVALLQNCYATANYMAVTHKLQSNLDYRDPVHHPASYHNIQYYNIAQRDVNLWSPDTWVTEGNHSSFCPPQTQHLDGYAPYPPPYASPSTNASSSFYHQSPSFHPESSSDYPINVSSSSYHQSPSYHSEPFVHPESFSDYPTNASSSSYHQSPSYHSEQFVHPESFSDYPTNASSSSYHQSPSYHSEQFVHPKSFSDYPTNASSSSYHQSPSYHSEQFVHPKSFSDYPTNASSSSYHQSPSYHREQFFHPESSSDYHLNASSSSHHQSPSYHRETPFHRKPSNTGDGGDMSNLSYRPPFIQPHEDLPLSGSHSHGTHHPPSDTLSCGWLVGENVTCVFEGPLHALKIHVRRSHLSGTQNAPNVCRWQGCTYRKRDNTAIQTMRRDCMWRHVKETHLGMKRMV
ncbi:uncharacterized protein EDB93DRAFT_551955 [Suillus bovinus]|uniref:uncharacterized protein n=1 Tax=Suillus bovinus TaxID=48563 RepID=UPI001B871070|nr:uncharacterized protein EDB93DRAFT_551955 [Suillus bovinus]KAG2158523.1 hypothetical protein EDB93DRAFT_551955 [Suillus bovinus]